MPDEYKRVIVEVLVNKYPNLIAVYLFGSKVNKQDNKNSDIDIAVLPKQPLDNWELWETAQTLASKLYQDLDIIDLLKASLVMRSQIITTGVCLCSRDNKVRETFENYVYSAYARFNEERRAILESIQQRGNIYG